MKLELILSSVTVEAGPVALPGADACRKERVLTPAARERAFLESMAADLAEIRPMGADLLTGRGGHRGDGPATARSAVPGRRVPGRRSGLTREW
jgi:hypothetical protein